MLNDAVAAERYKFLRHRSALFWGFCAVPLAMLLFNVWLETYLRFHTSGIVRAIQSSAGLDLGPQILRALTLGGSSFCQIFFVAGVAAIFAGEYRWETWRLLTPRNSRVNLLAAKFIVYALACAASLLALAVMALLYGLYGALLNGAVPAMPQTIFAGQFAGVFVATWAELLVLGAVTALVAVASRAMIGALLTGIFFSFAQGIAMAIVHPWEAPLRWFAALPSMDAYLLRMWVMGQQIAPDVLVDPAKILPAAGFLLAWLLVVGGAALALFRYQDLPRE